MFLRSFLVVGDGLRILILFCVVFCVKDVRKFGKFLFLIEIELKLVFERDKWLLMSVI